MIHKRWWLIPLILTMAIALVSCGGTPVPKALSTPVATTLPGAVGSSSSGAVTASGEIMPAQKAALSFAIAGRIQTINIAVGDKVRAGDVLIARLDDVDAKLAMAQAEATLTLAQAQLAQLKAAARPEQIVQAEQAVAQAEAAWKGAQAQHSLLKSGAHAADIAAAEAALAQAAAQRKVAQDTHDKTIDCFKVPKYGEVCPGLGTSEEQARTALAAAEEAYRAAQQRVDQLKAGATKNELGAAAANINATKAQVEQAKAQLALLQAGASPEQIAVAEAGVKQAQVAVDMAKAQLDKLQLIAPFDGTVAEVDVSPGEMVSPGQVVLVLGQQGQLRAETTDLSERDVWRIGVGNQATVYVEALGTEIKGRVVRIAPRSSKVGGDVVYTVIVELDEQPTELRWGMSVKVEIATE